MNYLEKIYNEQTKPIVKLVDGKYHLSSKYKLGTIHITANHITLQMKNSTQKIYIEQEHLQGAYQGDYVLVQVIFNPKGKLKAKVITILQRSNLSILCFVYQKELFSVKESLLIECEEVNNKNGDIVLYENGKISSKLGNIRDPKIDEKISLFLYNETYRLKGFQTNKFTPINLDNRVDLTHLEFCTIDPASAKDHDDAIYYDEKNSELFVAIADVSAYVKEGSPLDEEALIRSFSIYLPHKVLPMLPFELSTDLCSLVPNKIRPAYVFKMKLDTKKMSVVQSEVFEAKIESKHKYSYEYIDEVLEHNDPSNPYVKLYNLTSKFRQKRLQNGYDFRNDEIRLKLDDEENLISLDIESSTPSHSLVEECMLLANQEAAKKLGNLGIFRVHEEPSSAKIKKLLQDLEDLGINAQLKTNLHKTIESIQSKAQNYNLENEVDELIIQAQQQASYSNIKDKHFGLGFTNYSHFTSPIRRYADLVLHRILKSKKIPENIEDICEKISTTEREIANLVWDYEDRKYARAAEKLKGKTFEAKVVDLEKRLGKITQGILTGAKIELENYSGEKLFLSIQVKIISSNLLSKKITATIE